MRINKKSFKALSAVVFVLCALLLFASCADGKAEKENASKETGTETVPENAVDYKKLEGIYICKLSMSETMSVDLFLKIDKDGAFVFGRDTGFENTEKGAGKITALDGEKNVFLYTALNGETLKDGEKTAEYRLDGNEIVFTSPMWFGSTEPKITDENGNITYPRFVKYAPESAADTVPDENPETVTSTEIEETEPSGTAETAKPETSAPPAVTLPPVTEPPVTEPPATEPPATEPPATEPPATEPSATEPPATEPPATEPPATEPPAPVFSEGTYTGSMSKYVDAMSSNVRYDVTVTFSGGRYDYVVRVTLSGGMEYSTVENYSGTYTQNGDGLSMSGKMTGCKISGSTLELTGYLSSFAGAPETVNVSQ